MFLLHSYEEELRESRKNDNKKEAQRGGSFKNDPSGNNNTNPDIFERTVISFPNKGNRNSDSSSNPDKLDQSGVEKSRSSPIGEFREALGPNMNPQGYSGYPGYPGYPGGPGNQPGFPPYYPPYYPKRPMEPFGITSATLGIVSMCIFWLSVIPYFLGTLFFIIILTMSVLGIIFGAYSYANRMRRNTPGLVGLILSIIAIVLSSTVWSFTHMQYVAHYDMLVSFVF
jgi:hypothetical protein